MRGSIFDAVFADVHYELAHESGCRIDYQWLAEQEYQYSEEQEESGED